MSYLSRQNLFCMILGVTIYNALMSCFLRLTVISSLSLLWNIFLILDEEILDCINVVQNISKNKTKYSRSTVSLFYIQKYVGIIFIFDLLPWWRYMVLYNFMQVSFNKKVSRPKWTLSYPHQQPTCMCIYIWSIYLELVHYVFATLLILL